MKKILLSTVAALMVSLGVGLVSVAAPAGAQSQCEVYGPSCPNPTPRGGGDGGTTTTTVAGTPSAQSTPSTPAQVQAATATAEQPAAESAAASADESSLAFTGGDIAGIVALALGLLVVGMVVLRSSRRRATN